MVILKSFQLLTLVYNLQIYALSFCVVFLIVCFLLFLKKFSEHFELFRIISVLLISNVLIVAHSSSFTVKVGSCEIHSGKMKEVRGEKKERSMNVM